MIIALTQGERRALLRAVGNGRLDTSTIPRVIELLENPYSCLSDDELERVVNELQRKLT